MSSQFGDLFLSPEFDAAVVTFIDRWIDTYLSEVEARMGYPRRTLDRPRSYNAAIDLEHWPEEALPGILVVSAGITSPPDRDGGIYSGWWDWTVLALISARDYDATRKMTGMYQAALRALLTQRSSIDGAVSDTLYLGEPMDFAPWQGRDRTKGVAAFQLRSYVEGLVEHAAGPTDPDTPPVPSDPPPDPSDPPEPHPDWPTVDTVNVELNQEPLS